MAGFAGGAAFYRIEELLRRWPHDAGLRAAAASLLQQARASAAALQPVPPAPSAAQSTSPLHTSPLPTSGAASPGGGGAGIPSFVGIKALAFRSQVRGGGGTGAGGQRQAHQAAPPPRHPPPPPQVGWSGSRGRDGLSHHPLHRPSPLALPASGAPHAASDPPLTGPPSHAAPIVLARAGATAVVPVRDGTTAECRLVLQSAAVELSASRGDGVACLAGGSSAGRSADAHKPAFQRLFASSTSTAVSTAGAPTCAAGSSRPGAESLARTSTTVSEPNQRSEESSGGPPAGPRRLKTTVVQVQPRRGVDDHHTLASHATATGQRLPHCDPWAVVGVAHAGTAAGEAVPAAAAHVHSGARHTPARHHSGGSTSDGWRQQGRVTPAAAAVVESDAPCACAVQ
jgi:hypothetical protein